MEFLTHVHALNRRMRPYAPTAPPCCKPMRSCRPVRHASMLLAGCHVPYFVCDTPYPCPQFYALLAAGAVSVLSRVRLPGMGLGRKQSKGDSGERPKITFQVLFQGLSNRLETTNRLLPCES